ncbi:PAP2-domain-containing protein [Thozetella sp. PMI_491]|nr:PAP2-domain-containing protein [Thozetella sp. PMI_491]
MQEFTTVFTQQQAKSKMAFLPFDLSQFNPIPYRSKSEAGQQNDITRLKTSFNVTESIRKLRRRKWQLYDVQHAVVFAYVVFSLALIPASILPKLGALAALALLLLMPVTQQFFLPSLPIWTYLLYFFSSRYIGPEYRPHIWVKVLPALENVLYGANLSNILSTHTHPVLDIIAWIPYGLGHFALPAICSALLFLFAAPGTTPVFARAFGYMCMLGVTIQLILPCTPPWYEKAHGLEPAHYGMEGSPAGLARIDKLLGVDMYTTSFTTAPVPFGAFPSLHAANAVLEALFMQFCFPRFRPVFIFYVVWIFWATMYLNHHYAIDLVGGAVIAMVCYYVGRARWLPRPQLDKSNRWEYEYVDIGDRTRATDEEYGYGVASGYGLGLLERPRSGESDRWTLESSSSFESLSHSEGFSGSSATSSGSLSPATPEDQFAPLVVGMNSHGEVWDGQVGRETELSEVVMMR